MGGAGQVGERAGTADGGGGRARERRQRWVALMGAVLAVAAVVAAVVAPTPAAQAAPCSEMLVPPPDCPDPPPTTTRPTLPPVPGDNDGDRIVDAYEDQLLRRFAPRIWLHPDENRRPVDVNWLLSRSTLRYGHTRCPDHEILARGEVTGTRLTEQSHRDTHDIATFPPWNACQHFGADRRSDHHTGDIKESFFLQFTDASHSGSADRHHWRIYGHVYPTTSGRIVVQYWQLYPYNDSFGLINHEGDWEYTAVVVDAAERVQRVVFFRHGHDRDVAPSRVEWVGDHHVTYSAKGSHGQYRGTVQGDECLTEGLQDDVQGIADFCVPGTAWDTWTSGFGGIVNVGEKSRPLNGADWLRYSGLWGEVGFAAAGPIDYTSGPRGPAYQGSWNWRPPAAPPPTPPPTAPPTTTRPTTTTTRPPSAPPTRPPCPPQAPNCQEP